ncbi:META domain-containing protein [Desulfovibrio sp. Fe33]|uniref:META domain-containing protein n=1 Tax=Desulfovibrio sp. Fe33 TaxID=3020842 RepID=UPI00234DE02D|nr:META domain-containing protein [Desulfovibrio sp. Fe33]
MLTMWKRIGFAALLVAVLAALGACGTHNDAPTMSEDAIRQALVGKTWTLRKIVARSYDDDPARTLKFNADGTVEGFGGCNAFNGTYSLTGDQIEFSPMASTRKSCGPGLDEQEYTFLTFLAVVRHLRVEEDGSELVLLTESQGEMLFSSGSSGLFW